MSSIDDRPGDESRRGFFLKIAYVAPVILTLKAQPAFASYGSGAYRKGNNGVGNGQDPQPPGNPPVNDGPGTGPGNPGNGGNSGNNGAVASAGRRRGRG